MKNILLPTDFSKNAFNATKFALHLYEQEECTFHFLHTYTPATYSYSFSADGSFSNVETIASNQEKVYQESQDRLKEMLEHIINERPNEKHDFDVISAYNILTDEINEQISKRHIDLVIMGTKGDTNGGT